MSVSVRVKPLISAQKALERSAALWFVFLLMGQLFFAAYILVNYGASAAAGDYTKWNRNLIHPATSADLVGAVAIALHIALAFVVTVGGPLQVILAWLVRSGGGVGLPGALRARLLDVHRWNGRIYGVVAVVISVGAIYMTLTQRPILFKAGPIASAISLVAQDVLGVLIIVSAITAIWFARVRNLDAHRYWALLTFLFVSGVWFQRIGYGFWTTVTGQVPFGGGALGTTGNMDGWFDLSLTVARFALPWAVLDLYLRANIATDARVKWAMTALMIVVTGVIGIGTVGAARLMWLPSMMTPP